MKAKHEFPQIKSLQKLQHQQFEGNSQKKNSMVSQIEFTCSL